MTGKAKPGPEDSPESRPRVTPAGQGPPDRPEHSWTFLSNHAHVIVCLARDPNIRLRDVAGLIGITERAVLNIVADLEEGGLVERRREGRRNSYVLSLDRPLRHPLEEHHTVEELVKLLLD